MGEKRRKGETERDDDDDETVMDRCSVVPKEILQHILSYLSDQEAGRSSVLSKSWHEAWSTTPDLVFNRTLFFLKSSRRDRHENKDRFLKFVDNTMARRQKHNIPINKFRLSIVNTVDEKLSSLVHHWIRIAVQCGVKEVSLNLGFSYSMDSSSSSSSSLLRNVFSTKELVALRLSNCELKNHILDGLHCPHLKKLGFCNLLSLNEQVFQKILSCCVSIEDLMVSRCQGLKTIHVSNLPKLKIFHVNPCENQMAIIDAPNLEILAYGGLEAENPCLLDVKESRNVKELVLASTSITDEFFRKESHYNVKELVLANTSITDECFHKLIAKFPLLEKLSVKWCNMIHKINVSIHSLNLLSFTACNGLVEAKIDSPNLRLFSYVGNSSSIPSFSPTSDHPSKRQSSILLDCSDPLDNSWFQKLSEFLKTLRTSDSVNLLIKSQEISFAITEDLRENKPELDELHLTFYSPITSTYASTVMEAVLWSCSPKALTLRWEAIEAGDAIDYICQELMKGHDKRVQSYNCSNDDKSCRITFNR